MHGGMYPSAVSIPREGATHASQSKFCLVFSLIVFQATLAENVWPPCSKSVCSHFSAALWTVVFVRAWICIDDTQASHQQAKGWQCHLSQNIGPGSCQVCRTFSAAPVQAINSSGKNCLANFCQLQTSN